MDEPTRRYTTFSWPMPALALLLGLVTGLFAHPQAAVSATLVGPARVIDGDTLEIAGQRVRLEGIDAPESAQRCRRAWLPGRWRCGIAAERMMRRLIVGRQVACERVGTDKYKRMLGVCFVEGKDINAEMVRLGYAWAFTKYSKTYVAEKARARNAKRGIWWAETEPAWDYRKSKWAASEQTAPEGCAIKGNITKTGPIYHMPWSPRYRRVRIAKDKGERWFCSEAEARSAGWRPVGGGA